MSDSEEVIISLNKSIQEKTNEISLLQDQLRSLSDTPENLKQRKQLARRILQKKNAIKQNKQQLITLNQMQQTIDTAQRITSDINKRKQTSRQTPKLTSRQTHTSIITEPEEQRKIYDQNKIPTPDENYIKDEKDKKEEKDDDNINLKNSNLNNSSVSGPREIEMANLGYDNKMVSQGKTQKNRGIIPKARLSTPLPSSLNKTRRNKNIPNDAGFSETMVRKKSLTPRKIRPNIALCQKILHSGKKINSSFFIPSQFPNLTKPKPLIEIKTQTKGGRKSRRYIKK
jgi:hypothetical protein